MIPTVRVVGKVYTIVMIEPGQDYGQCRHDACEIDISTGQCDQQKADTLLHEIVHAVDHELQCGMREAQVRRLATGLLAVLRDNPALVAYLTA